MFYAGLLVEDGASHDSLRRAIMPSMHRQQITEYLKGFVRRTDQVTQAWRLDQPLDMLVEMRRAALLILLETLFGVDISPDIDRLWPAILRTLKYISPGAWLLWRDVPRPGYSPALQVMDDYLYGLIAAQRQKSAAGDHLLAQMVASGLSDDLIRDQMLTLLIAGHDTSTALLSWALYLLAAHPAVQQQAQDEI